MEAELSEREKHQLIRTRLLLAVQRLLFELARDDAEAAMSREARHALVTEIEGARLSDQDIADRLGDHTGAANDDFFPSLGLRGTGSGVSQVVTFQRVQRGNTFGIAGDIDQKTWDNIRTWMNQIIGCARAAWDQWSAAHGVAQKDITFDAAAASLFFTAESPIGIGFVVQALTAN